MSYERAADDNYCSDCRLGHGSYARQFFKEMEARAARGEQISVGNSVAFQELSGCRQFKLLLTQKALAHE